MNKEDFDMIGHVEFENLEMYNIRYLPTDKKFLDENKIDIEQWDIHDWKNVIAFKSIDAWYDFIHALECLIGFYNKMEIPNKTFKIFYKSYNIDNLTELQNDSCNFIREIYWNDILDAAKRGYFLIYLTTQRECHDRNQFLMYMLDNWMYERSFTGHRVNEEDEIEDIEFIVLNEK